MAGKVQVNERWRGLLAATAAIGLALYLLRSTTTYPLETRAKASQKPQPQSEALRQEEDCIDNMDPEERTYHERFMREAIAMVNHTLFALLSTVFALRYSTKSTSSSVLHFANS